MPVFPIRPKSDDSSRGFGVRRYIRHAFRNRWNLLLFIGGSMIATLSPWPDALVPMIFGLELAYLTSLISIPRFRTAVDAKLAADAREAAAAAGGRVVSETAQQSLQRMMESLSLPAQRRFLILRQRCFEMRDIASGVRGTAGGGSETADSISTPSLDRLLFLFLKLLVTQGGLDRFLKSTSEEDLSTRRDTVKTKLAAAQAANDERVTNSLKDSLADAELRVDNYLKSKKDADFVAVELDRIETKIQALIEMGVSRQDPNFLSTQVNAAAESMQHTEDTVNQLQHLTGLADQIEEPPAILGADLDRMAIRDR